MKTLFVVTLLFASQLSLAQELPTVTCDITDAVRTFEGDEVFNDCSDGSSFYTYVVRENNGLWSAGTQFPLAGSSVPGMEIISIPKNYQELLPKFDSQTQGKWVLQAWLIGAGACYVNHHATIAALIYACSPRGGVKAIKLGFCGMHSTANCFR